MAESEADRLWRSLLLGEAAFLRKGRHFFRLLPHGDSNRCKLCLAPFDGIGAVVARMMGKRPANKSPRYCNDCEVFAGSHRGGAEIELTLLFADVRGSTAIAQSMSAAAFGALMNRFYATAMRALVASDALIDKLVGDEVVALYIPGFCGADHADKALNAACRILGATGHGEAGGADRPWVPVGIGIHSGMAYVGTVGAPDGFTDFTALGDVVNFAARLASQAETGEILISDAALAHCAAAPAGLARREVILKGYDRPVGVNVVAGGMIGGATAMDQEIGMPMI
ncbi:MAG: adenylate/guanylate cyclase domain-containing protein [Reyranellaceae bacterium]